MTHIKLSATVFVFLTLTAFAWASEPDELRAKAQEMQREAAELAEQGHQEEATNLKRKAKFMLEEAERLQHGRLDERQPIMKLKQWLEKLRQEEKHLVDEAGSVERLADVRRKAEMIEDKLRYMSDDSKHEQGGPHDDIARRLKHMRIAAEHLHQAGLYDIAEHVAERAEATERELHEQQRNREGNGMHEVMKQLDELRHEVGRLRNEVNDLKQNR